MKSTLLVIVTLTAFITACNSVETKRNFICFIDLSGSINDKTFNEYTQILVNDIYHNLKRHDQIRIYPLDYASRIKNDPIYHEDLSSLSFNEQIKTVSHRKSEIERIIGVHKKELSDSLINIILNAKAQRKDYSFETDILGALEKVYREKIEANSTDNWDSFNSYVNGEKVYEVENYIILFSDMIHEEGSINFNKLTTTTQAEQLVALLEENNRIPNMADFKIYINGITAKNNTSLSAIEHFWEGYFKQAKGSVLCLNYNCGYELNDYIKN